MSAAELAALCVEAYAWWRQEGEQAQQAWRDVSPYGGDTGRREAGEDAHHVGRRCRH